MYSSRWTESGLYHWVNRGHSAIQLLDSTLQLNKLNLLTYLRNSREAIEKAAWATSKVRSSDYEGMIRKLPKSQRDILNIQRRLQVNEKMYLFLLEKRASTVISRAGIVPQDQGHRKCPQLGRGRPDKAKVVYTFLLGGLLIAAIVIFVRMMFYDRIENADELKELTTCPSSGRSSPVRRPRTTTWWWTATRRQPSRRASGPCGPTWSTCPAPEGLGKVVTGDQLPAQRGQDLLFGEPERHPGQGRQEGVAAGTRPAQAQGGHGSGHDSQVGLSNVLIGKMPWREVVLPTQFEHFSVILAGPHRRTPPN
jgi:tyrosine-protein kinase Etk/Wzc